MPPFDGVKSIAGMKRPLELNIYSNRCDTPGRQHYGFSIALWIYE
jgi:hypothetical protein